MPELHILAGPNGAGKTTYYNTAIQQDFIDPGLPFLNADNICRYELGGYSSENSIKADQILKERMQNYIDHRGSFMIESNLALQADYDWIDKMKNAGYAINLHFMCTVDVEINIARVRQRMNEGGHNIPEAIIRQRYNNGLMYLKGKLHLFNDAILIDNSETEPRNVAIISNGKLTEKNTNCPKWAQELLYIIEKLAAKQKD